MLINLDYHDVYWENAKYKVVRMDPDAWLKTVFAAMKPGGIVGVVDHAAKAGSDAPRKASRNSTGSTRPWFRADFERAGFVLDGTSDMYKNPADDHSLRRLRQGDPGQDRPLRLPLPEAQLSEAAEAAAAQQVRGTKPIGC